MRSPAAQGLFVPMDLPLFGLVPFRRSGGFRRLGRQLPLHRHAPVDGGAHGVELGLIVGHHPLDAVPVEVVGDLGGLEAPGRKLLHRKGKQAGVVGLKVDLPPVWEHLAVLEQEVPVGQPPLGVALGGPGIAEVDIEPGSSSLIQRWYPVPRKPEPGKFWKKGQRSKGLPWNSWIWKK